jgi:hypothetical protein
LIGARFLVKRTIALDQAETVMTNMQIKALENKGPTAVVWTEGYDGQTHYGDVFKALTPALFILATAAGLLVAVL